MAMRQSYLSPFMLQDEADAFRDRSLPGGPRQQPGSGDAEGNSPIFPGEEPIVEEPPPYDPLPEDPRPNRPRGPVPVPETLLEEPPPEPPVPPVIPPPNTPIEQPTFGRGGSVSPAFRSAGFGVNRGQIAPNSFNFGPGASIVPPPTSSIPGGDRGQSLSDDEMMRAMRAGMRR